MTNDIFHIKLSFLNIVQRADDGEIAGGTEIEKVFKGGAVETDRTGVAGKGNSIGFAVVFIPIGNGGRRNGVVGSDTAVAKLGFNAITVPSVGPLAVGSVGRIKVILSG